MTSYKTNRQQIAKNTGLLYVRSLLNLFLSLYTSRLVLQALGVEDYGIYNAVGGFVSMFWVVTGALNGAITRFITFEMGRPEKGNAKAVFSLALTLLLSLGIIVILVAETAGIWYLQSRMTIPEERVSAAFWVFQTVIFISASSLVSAPFNSVIVAHEKFGVYAFLNIGETILLYGLALFLVHASCALDLLIVYAVGRGIISLLSQLITIVYSCLNFEESRFRLGWNKGLFKQLFDYTGWSLFGSFANMFSGQGVNVALNVFCGPAVNAARGLTFTVTNSVGIFVNNFTIALVPQITKSYAAQDRHYFLNLVFKGSKLAFFIMLFFVVPLFVEADFVLSLWLKDVPEYTVTFTRLALIATQLAMFDNILSQAQRASGRIRVFQIIASIISLFNFLISYIALKIGFSPVAVYVVGVFAALACVCLTTFISSRTHNIPIGTIVRKIYLPDAIVMFVSSLIPILLHLVLPYGWQRFILILISSIVSIFATACLIGFSKEERYYYIRLISDYLSSFHNKVK